MSLWTPYTDAPLDLTKGINVKKESNSPPPSYSYVYGYTYQQQPTYSYQQQPAPYPYFGYHQPPMHPGSISVSPVSGSSSSSSRCVTSPQAPQTLSPPVSPTEADLLSDDPDFQMFERDAMRAMAEKNGGTLLGTNPRMRRAVRSSKQDAADDSYRAQRERNNIAAKQSRDRRKLREIHLALKVAYLKNEVATLKAKLANNTCSKCLRKCDC